MTAATVDVYAAMPVTVRQCDAGWGAPCEEESEEEGGEKCEEEE